MKSGLVECGLVKEELRNVDVGSVISSCYAKAVWGTSIDWNIAVEPVQAVLCLLLGEAVNRTLSFILVVQAVGYPALVVELAGGTLVGPFLGDGGGVSVLAVPSLLEVGTSRTLTPPPSPRNGPTRVPPASSTTRAG